MINSSYLDTAIAVVLVILVLSLVVQAVQAAFKKLFNIKSRQIEDSLIDLFETFVPNVRLPTVQGFWTRMTAASPMLRLLRLGVHPSDPAAHPDPRVKELFTAVMNRAKALGRTSITGKQVFGSLHREDLLRSVKNLQASLLFPDIVSRLQKVYDLALAVESAERSIESSRLEGDISAIYAAFREKIAPLLNDLHSLASGDEIRSDLLIHDIANVREVDWGEVFLALARVQQKVEAAITQASQAGATDQVNAFKAANAALSDLAAKLADLRRELDAVRTSFSSTVKKLESSYDAARTSLQERYARSMKTWAIVISIVTVVVLNANFFNIYQSIATGDAKRSLILQSREEIEKLYERNTKAPSAQSQAEQNVQQWFQAARQQIDQNRDVYAGFGFHPLGTAQISWWWSTVTTYRSWWQYRLHHDLRVLIGWLIMALLLSVGAPFWEDALESLLGVKSVLQEKAAAPEAKQP
jgi:hypothetical protein